MERDEPALSTKETAKAVATIALNAANRTNEDLRNLSEQLKEHTAADQAHFQTMNSTLALMKDNHLYHIEKDMKKVVEGMESLHLKIEENTKETLGVKMEALGAKTNISWIIRIGAGAWAAALILFGAMVVVVREAIAK